MRIFITGGLGFIGSNFIHELIKDENNSILNYDSMSYAANPKNLSNLENLDNYIFVKGDICDKDFFYDTLLDFKPDVLVNFAAESHVDRSIESPMTFVNTNIVGTANLLQGALNFYLNYNSDFQFIHVSTDEVFGELGKTGKFNDETSYNPKSPYSASKASSDHLVRSWYHTFGLPIKITNCSNNYGPYQFPEKLIPLMIIKGFNLESLPIYGDGSNVRDWIYVSDHCKAILRVIKSGEVGSTYLIGGGNEYSNLEIVNIICEVLDQIKPLKNDNYKKLITFVKDRPGHDFRYAIDNSSITNRLGWEPEFDFMDGIRDTVKWYLENEEWWHEIISKKYNLDRLGEKK